MADNTKYTIPELGNYPGGGNGQFTTGMIDDLADQAVAMGYTSMANHFQMDTAAQFLANWSNYAASFNLRTIEADTQLWAQRAHLKGLAVCYRGSFSGIKNNYGFPFVKYGTGSWIPNGTLAGASAEGETTYTGKLWRFMNVNVGAANWENGDIMAPVSEGTEFLANSNMLWFDAGPGVQAGYVAWYLLMKQVVDLYGATIGKSIKFMTFNNYSEIRTQYGIAGTVINGNPQIITCDYYGHYSASNGTNCEPANYVADWNAVITAISSVGLGTYPVGQSELGGIWGDSWPSRVNNYEDSVWYQIQLFRAYRDSLIDLNKMTLINNWGLWAGQNSSIVRWTGTNFKPNIYGQIFANFLLGNGMARIPVPTSTTWDSFGNRSNYF